MSAQAARRPPAPRRRSVEDVIKTYLGAAAAHPERADRVYRDAARTLAGLAQDPLNRPFKSILEGAALEFAGASAGWQAPPVVDDFRELLVDTAAAREALGGTREDLAVEAGRRVVAEAHEAHPRVKITPPSLDWACLGRAGKYKFNPTDEERAAGIIGQGTLAFWQGSKDEAQAATVDVALLAAPPTPSGLPSFLYSVRPFVSVEYGSDGGKAQVTYDLSLGRRITVVGNYVSVLVGMDPPAPGLLSAVISVEASIGMFAAPSVAPVVRTTYIDLSTGSTSALLPIPLKAAQLLPLVTSAVGGTSTVRFYGFGDVGATMPVGSVSYPATSWPVPVPGDAFFFTVTNATGVVAGSRYRLPWQLSL